MRYRRKIRTRAKAVLSEKRRRRSIAYEGRLALCVAAIILTVIILLLIITKTGGAVKIANADVQAFRVPYSALTELYTLSEKYKINYPKLLTVYSLDQNFFPKDYNAQTVGLEARYILNYDSIGDKYPQEDYAEYYKIMSAIFTEIKAFPVSNGFTASDYMFGDSFGEEKQNGEKGTHYGTDIIDRSNVSGRIELQSMTDGVITAIGKNSGLGNYIEICSYYNTVYRYAQLESTGSGLQKGDIISAGQFIGKMGGEPSPVRLHLDIAPETGLGKAPFYVNPYMILRYAEWRFRE